MSLPDVLEPDGLAAAELDARFRRSLMSYFVRRVGDRAEAEDLTQQTFVRLMGAEDRSRVASPAAFVFRVAANLLKDRRRSQLRCGAARTISLDDAVAAIFLEVPAEVRDPERVLLAREDLARVLQSLDGLGERTRDIFVLFRLENMRQQAIADLFGMTRRAVEKHVMRATLHLARTYGAS